MELRFNQAGGNHGLGATLPCNGSKAEEINEFICGAAGLEVGGMSCIKAANQLTLEDEGERRKIGIFSQEQKGDARKSIKRGQTVEHNTP